MIVLSLILVIAAAVLLVAGFFQDSGLTLIYASIGSCVLAMVLLGVGVLQRRRSSEPATSGGYGPGAGSGSSPAPVRPSSRTAEKPEAAAQEEVAAETAGDESSVIVTKTAARDRAERAAGEASEETKPAEEPVPAEDVEEEPAKKEQAPVVAGRSDDGEALTQVKGVGPAKRDALLEAFGSVEGVRRASEAELGNHVGGVVAKRLKQQLGQPETSAEPEARKATAKKATAKKATAKKATAKKATAKKASTEKKTTGAAAKKILSEISGVGAAKQDALLAEFGSIEGIRQASKDELTEVKGIGEGLADRIKKEVG